MTDFFDYWLKFDKWSYKQTALIFNGHDPIADESEIDFSLNSNELDRSCKKEWHKDVMRSYILLHNINCSLYWPGGSNKWSIAVIQLLAMAKEKDIELPDGLVEKLIKKPKLYKYYSNTVESETTSTERPISEEHLSTEKSNSSDESVTPIKLDPQHKNQMWREPARQIGIEMVEQYPQLSVEQISHKVHQIMKDREIVGRGGRVPSTETIRRHALSKLKG